MQSSIAKPARFLSVARGLVMIEGSFSDAQNRPAKKVTVHLGNRTVICRTIESSGRFTAVFRSRGGLKYLMIRAETEGGQQHVVGRRLIFFSKKGQSEVLYQRWQEEDRDQNPPAPAPAKGPTVSIVLSPASFRPHELSRTINSLLKQSYPQWELQLMLPPAAFAQAQRTPASIAPPDARIRVHSIPAEDTRADAANAALAVGTGDFFLRLEPGDQLASHALAEIARSALVHPEAKLIYSDEDHIDSFGLRSDPRFKPAWNPELLLSHNYIGRLVVYRTALLRELGGFRATSGTLLDWDLALRATATLPLEAILHVPRVLCHTFKAATTRSEKSTENAEASGRHILAEHLARSGIDATPEPLGDGLWRVRRHLPRNPPRVSLIIPTRNGLALLRTCVESILRHTRYPNYEILVIDNGSDEPATLAYLENLKTRGVKVLRDDGPFNYSAINNRAVAHATGEVLGFLNNDLEAFTPDWLEEMTSQVLAPGVGAVGAMLYFPDDRVQHAGVVLGIAGPRLSEGVAGHAFKFAARRAPDVPARRRVGQNYSAVTAACLLVRREAFEKIGGFDEQNLAVAYNDVDLCLRLLTAGYRNVWTPFAELYHHESATRGTDTTPEKKARYESEVAYMRKRWAPLLDNDPAYNPNLTHLFEDFSTPIPPRPAASPRTASPLFNQ